MGSQEKMVSNLMSSLDGWIGGDDQITLSYNNLNLMVQFGRWS